MQFEQDLQLWSALPTPLKPDLTVDEVSVTRLIHDAIRTQTDGVFLAGTCGEGPWLPDGERVRLVQAAVRAAGDALKLAAQVTDNSVPRVRDNIRRMADAGAQVAIVASPATFINATPDRLVEFFTEIVAASELPVGIYDLGGLRPHGLPVDRLAEVYRLAGVCLIKDSSGDAARREVALAVQAERPELGVFNGDEFRCLEYLQAGYRGMMFGGAAVVAGHLRRIMALAQAGRWEEARPIEADMRRVLYGVYGGKEIACWLTGLKHYLVRAGLFASADSYLGFPLHDSCRHFIEREIAARD